ncbi:MAG: AAA family ATPase, partial [Muribaculaceae bacterium]|nr:AAA family ATPase [Muribaculaceae bacterium]
MSNVKPLIDTKLANDIYKIIDTLIDSQESKRDIYSTIRRVFGLATDIATRPFGIAFSGLLPRVDFLIKKIGKKRISSNDVARIHSLRFGLARLDNTSDDFKLPDNTHIDDISTLARWIEILSLVPIPATLSARLPGHVISPHKVSTRIRSIRFILDKIIDGKFVGRLDDGDMTDVTVLLSTQKEDSFDFSYLLEYAQPGDQYNLVNYSADGSVLTPELIIYEPDHLIDISSVSECFTAYGTSAWTSIIKKLSSDKITRPILLGLFAGQLLDMVINNPDNKPVDYNEAAKQFFKTTALRIAACDDIDSSFHNDAKLQLANIERAVNSGLTSVNGFDRSLMLLEPSFFSETLGLQGRMDMLQTDFVILVEQKSGKGAWGSDPHGAAKPSTPHYVQLLLYQAILHYNFDVKGKDLSSFLLYSKYPTPLVRTSNAPRLLAEAFKVRNEIAYLERLCAAGEGFATIKNLAPDDLNVINTNSSLWNNFQKPQLESVLNLIKQADPITVAYVERMLKFVAMEHSYAKTGFNGETSTAGFSAAWAVPPADKKNAGDLCDNLTLTIDTDDDNPIETVRLLFNESEENDTTSNFRRGDIVVLYSYHEGHQPDLRRSIVIRASVMSIDTESITLSLRAPQSNRNIFTSGRLWAIEHDFIDSSIRQLYRNTYALLSAPTRRREVVVGLRKPESDSTLSLIGEYGDFSDLVLKALQAQDMFLIIGPPGAGKTSHGLLNILHEHLLHGNSILAGAYTNRAVDEICARLEEENINYIRIGSPLGCAPEYQSRLLEEKLGDCKNVNDVKRLVSSVSVVVGTVQALTTASSTLFTFRHFDLAIIDEASQILEPHILGLLSACNTTGKPAISKFIFIGDHCQLPAVVMQPIERSRVDSPELHKIRLTDCRISFFERMLNVLKQPDRTYPHDSVYFL